MRLMSAKLPKPGTRRRTLYDLLSASPGQWVEFDPTTIGYGAPRQILTDLRDFREVYAMDIRCAGNGHPGLCRWRYVPSPDRGF